MDSIVALSYLVTMAGTQSHPLTAFIKNQENLRLFVEQGDHNYWRIHARATQCKGRYSVQDSEVKSHYIAKDLQI